MPTKIKPAKPNLLNLVSKNVLDIDIQSFNIANIRQTCQTKPTQFGVKIGPSKRFGVISLNPEIEPCSSSKSFENMP